jgi:DNA-binding beta-propeller fold protein YncE
MVTGKLISPLIVLILIFISVQCGERIELPTALPFSEDRTLDTTYVQVTPVWTEAGGVPFKEPEDILVGYDTYLYIADTGNDRIVKLDRRGEFVAEYPVSHPISVAQDPLLRLATVSGESEIYLKDIFDQKPFHEVFAFEKEFDTLVFVVDSSLVIDSTFYPDSLDTTVVVDTLEALVDTISTLLKAIAATPIPKEEYLFFTCDQTGHTFVGPGGEKHQRDQISSFTPRVQDAALVFRYDGPVVPKGGDLAKTIFPSGIFTYPHGSDFRIAFSQGYTPNGVQILNGRTYRSVIPRTDSTELYFPAMFGLAEDVVVDEFDNIYVVDASRHAVSKFNSEGRLLLRFGSFGSGNKEFQRPKGIAYYNKTLYVADTGNNRILRFKLSTDIRR